MAVIPTVVVQEVLAGNLYSGAAPNAPASKALLSGGSVAIYREQGDGGKLDVDPNVGLSVGSVAFVGPGTTKASLVLEDPDGTEFVVWSESATPESFFKKSDRGWDCPPGFSMKFVTEGALTGDARVVFIVSSFWGGSLAQLF